MRCGLLFLNYLKHVILMKKDKNKLLYLAGKYTIAIPINTNLKLNKNLNSITWLGRSSPQNFKFFLERVNLLLKALNSFLLEKITFNGRGFKIKKIQMVCLFLFNKSHPVYIVQKSSKVAKSSKNTILLIGKSKVANEAKNIIKIFKQNKFTKKGLRTAQQLVITKKNKN